MLPNSCRILQNIFYAKVLEFDETFLLFYEVFLEKTAIYLEKMRIITE